MVKGRLSVETRETRARVVFCSPSVPGTGSRSSLIAWGQTEITAGLAAILNATTPLFASIIAGLTLADERLSARKVGGVILGLAGVAVMIGPAYLLDLGQHLPYQLAVVGAAFSYGIAAVLGRQFARLKVAPTMAATGQLSATAVMLVPVALLHDGPVVFFVTDPAIWLTVFANAALSTALAYILYFAILSRSGATNVTLVTVLVPVVAILIGVFGLGEHIGAIPGIEEYVQYFLSEDVSGFGSQLEETGLIPLNDQEREQAIADFKDRKVVSK